MLNKTKTLTTMAREKKTKEKALKWTSQIRKEPYENHSEKNRPLQNAKNKTTKKKSADRKKAKSSKKQHSDNTDQWHLCKAGSFSYGESPRTPPLEGTSLHQWNNSVERPWGILSLFTTCLWFCVNHPATGCDMWTTPKKHTKRRETLENANQNKTARRTGHKVSEKNPPKEAFRIKEASWNAEQNKNTTY